MNNFYLALQVLIRVSGIANEYVPGYAIRVGQVSAVEFEVEDSRVGADAVILRVYIHVHDVNWTM